MMSAHEIDELKPEGIKAALCGFYHEALEIADTQGGLCVAMPVLMPDGWQTVVHMQALTPCQILLTDQGKIATYLRSNGLNPTGELCSHIIASRCKQWAIAWENETFSKLVRLPFDAKELQLFAEFLSSVAFLIYRAEMKTHVSAAANQVVGEMIHQLGYKVKKRYAYPLNGQTVSLDYWVQAAKTDLAIKTFDAKTTANELMEVWSYRMSELKLYSQTPLETALVYNEDVCEVGSSILELAARKCDFVCPIHRQDELRDYLAKA